VSGAGVLVAEADPTLAGDGGVDGQRTERTCVPPFLQYGLLVVACGVIALGLVGLVTADVGTYRPALVVAVGSPLGAVLVWLGWRALPAGAPRGGATGWGVAAVVVVGLFVGVNAAHASEHLFQDRDPAVYVNTARWVATHGSLEVPVVVGPNTHGNGLNQGSPGMYIGDDPGHLEFQFSHLLPVLMAEGFRIGGASGMLAVPALLTGCGLLAFYAAACLFLRRPALAFAATAIQACCLPMLFVSRDGYSESVTLFLLWCGTFLWMASRSRSSTRLALVAGVVLGTVAMARIDALVYLIPVPIVVAVEWLRVRSREEEVRRSARGRALAFLVGAIPMVVIGVIDLRLRSTGYYEALGSEVTQLWGALAASAALSVAAVVLLARGVRLPLRVSAPARRIAGDAAAAVVILLVIVFWFVRPAVTVATQTTNAGIAAGVANLQAAEHVAVQPNRIYDEQSVRWLSWYVGPVTIALAAVGAALLVRMLVRRGRVPDLFTVLFVAGGSALYIWKPSITPEQLWAMRRFVPAAIPGLFLFAAFAVDAAILTMSRRRVGRLACAGVVALLVGGMLIPTAARSWQVRAFVEGDGSLGVVEDLCSQTGPSASLVILDGGLLPKTLQQPARSWCNVPAASENPGLTSTRVQDLAREWRAAGRTLWVVSSDRAHLLATVPGAHVRLTRVATNDHHVERTLTHPPDTYDTEVVGFYFARADGG
jgi:hypothetical protein